MMYARIIIVSISFLCFVLLSIRSVSSELDCESSYSPETGKAIIPCVNVREAETVFYVEMQQRGTNGNQLSFDVDNVSTNTAIEERTLIIKAFRENTSIKAAITKLEQSGYESLGIKIVLFDFSSGFSLNSSYLVIDFYEKPQYPPMGTSVLGRVFIDGRKKFELGGVEHIQLMEVSED